MRLLRSLANGAFIVSLLALFTLVSSSASYALFDTAVGHDNLFNAERYNVSVRLTVINLTNKQALYNYLSTFSGTHYVTRARSREKSASTFETAADDDANST